MTERRKTICRACHHFCSVEAEVTDGAVVRITGDDDNPIYHGYTCVKGREHPALYRHPDRLLHPLKRTAGGDFVRIPLDQAIGEIAERLDAIRDRHGPRSVAMFGGTFFFLDNPVNLSMGAAFMAALGSPMSFSPNSIDQPGKFLAKGLHGLWMAPGQALHDPDVALLVGTNPLVSHIGRFGNPGDFPKDIARRGATLIVIDPRATEIARRATIHLQVRPGTDVAVLAAMIRVILTEGLHDGSFVGENVSGVDDLRRAVEPFVPERAAALAGIDAGELVAAARAFGSARRGYAVAGTGANMGNAGTLLEYLLLCLDTISGHWMRAGEPVRNAMSLVPTYAQLAKAQAVPPFPSFGFGEPVRVRGLTQTAAGMPSGALADEILLPGEGQVRALLSLGANPATSLPDQHKTTEALSSLELLVQADVQMTATARLAHYILPAMLPYEMPGTTIFSDFMCLFANGWGLPHAFAQYTPALVDPPTGSEVIELWRVLYRLAQRMDLKLQLFPGVGELMPGGEPAVLDMTTDPTNDELFDVIHAGSRIPLDDVRRQPAGRLYPDPPVVVEAKDPDWEGRLDVGNATMMADLAAEADRLDRSDPDGFPFRLTTRRMMHVYNTPTVVLPKNRPAHNPAFLHSRDLGRLGVADGDIVEIRSARGAILAVAGRDDSLREGVVSISHAFGDGPDSDADVRSFGSNPSRLLATDEVFDPYSGQPRMSAIPVQITPVQPRFPVPKA
ncbi:MAG TPA: molybdopterin-dependent oxidoreductase [Acidimicrobiia bacterium]|nr:molybdopterin-dependent oxidoreductase [Acidimicrobiia bacterium]